MDEAAAATQDARLTAQDMARIRTLAAVLRNGSSNAPLVLGGRGTDMAARALARALGLDLYRIDLSAVVSKYVGETEKNLERLFATAGANAIVLFLDEADALFGKRTEVADSHDRYANAEINSLVRGLNRGHGLAVFVSKTGADLPLKLRHRFLLYRFPPAGLR